MEAKKELLLRFIYLKLKITSQVYIKHLLAKECGAGQNSSLKVILSIFDHFLAKFIFSSGEL